MKPIFCSLHFFLPPIFERRREREKAVPYHGAVGGGSCQHMGNVTNPLNCSFTSAQRAREFRDMDIIHARMSPCLYLVSVKIVQIARKKITLHYRHYQPLSAIRCANILLALSCSKCPHVCGTCKNLTRVLQTMKIYNILSWNQRGLRSKQNT
jgi:hypothetical protein